MARFARLSAAAPAARLLVLLAVVLLVHSLALDWLARHLAPPSLLRPLATPLFTRVLQQEAPVAPPVAPAAEAAPAVPIRPAITSLAQAQPSPVPAQAASQPKPKRQPKQESEAVHEAPAVPREPPEVAATTVDASTTVAVAPETTPTPESAPAVVPSTPVPLAPSLPTTAASAPALPASAPSPALDHWPADTRLSYRLGGNYRGELHGSAQVQWQRQDNRYQTRVEIDLTLLANLVLTSQGEVTPQGLVPRVYEELRRRRGPRGARLGDESIVLNDGRSVPRPAGVQDTASQFVELSHRFASGREVLEVGRSVSFWMARPGGVDLWTYDIVGRELLQTPELGAIDTFRLKPRPITKPRGKISAEMWFAPSLQYLPVRIRVDMGEDTYVDLIVLKIEQR